jgi:ABC-type phosphate/phosphonate transport system ATPase subunit
MVQMKNVLKNFRLVLKIFLGYPFKFFILKCKHLLNSLDSKLGYPFRPISTFEDLTPVIIEDETYINALNWAIKNKNVKNIALTGSYGSGKSSILKTFKEKHKEFKYLDISLATFEDEKRGDELNQKIELSILQQMLYLEKGKNLPNSRFKRIKNYKLVTLVSSPRVRPFKS